jgi:hypothetical protein
MDQRPPPILVRSGEAKSEIEFSDGPNPDEAPGELPPSVASHEALPMPADSGPLTSPDMSGSASVQFSDEAPTEKRAPAPELLESETRALASRPTLPAHAFAGALIPVKILGRTVPLWAIGTVLVLLLAGLSFTLGRASATSNAPAEATASSAPSSQPPVHAPVTGEAKVDDATMKVLESKSEALLTSAEVLTLVEGRRQRDLEAVTAFRKRLEHDPRSIGERAVAAQFRSFLANRDTARHALAAVASLPGPVGPDIIYEVWTGTAQRTDVTELARMLAYSKDVRESASRALAVALDLRAAETCEQSKTIVGRAQEQGDRRSLHLLGKLLVKSGCGPSKHDDCYACLRTGDDLKKAIAAVGSRPAPSPLPSP